MYRQCVNAQAKERQQQIAIRYLRLIEKRGLSFVPISELCRSLPIPRRVFYRYFETREDVIDYLYDALVTHQSNLFDLIRAETAESFEPALLTYMLTWKKYGILLMKVLLANDLIERELRRTVSEILQLKADTSSFESVERYYAIYLRVWISLRYTSVWIANDCREDPVLLANRLARVGQTPWLGS